jgi:hypothetical protein
MGGGEILYGTDVIPSGRLCGRQPRRLQSSFAAALAARLSTSVEPEALISKSHSRALVAAACAGSPVTAIGIDIEWMAPDRAFSAILTNFLPSIAAPVACDVFYRAWTFLEAHYKALQRWPGEDELRQVLAEPTRDAPWQTASGNHLVQHRVHDDFQLTLLWRSDTPCGVRYVR